MEVVRESVPILVFSVRVQPENIQVRAERVVL
jgi:hypothetical protein